MEMFLEGEEYNGAFSKSCRDVEWIHLPQNRLLRGNCRVKVKQARYRPGVAQRVAES
jgi:hypothetical protein